MVNASAEPTLYVPSRHFALQPIAWNPGVAAQFAQDILEESEKRFSEATLWPAHPLDQENSKEPLPTMYLGTEGMAWAIHYWHRQNGTRTPFDVESILQNCLRRDLEGAYPQSYFFGTVGIRLALQAVQPTEKNFQLLLADLEKLRRCDTNEMMAGAPGALIAGQLLWELSPRPELPAFLRATAGEICDQWHVEPTSGLKLWQQNYYQKAYYLGAAHGAIGNIFALLRVQEHLNPELVKKIHADAIELVKAAALTGSDGANWPTLIPQGKRDYVLHWCHGAPGIVMLLAGAIPQGLDAEFDQLLVKAGHLIAKAGGLERGPSICHGTAGSGAALLKLYERTGDAKWLNQARNFAMTAVEQSREHERKYGQRRYSVWTGDIGVALFVQDCLEGKSRLPQLDVI